MKAQWALEKYEPAFKWSLAWKLTDMKLKKVISPYGQIYLNVYMFRNDMKFIMD